MRTHVSSVVGCLIVVAMLTRCAPDEATGTQSGAMHGTSNVATAPPFWAVVQTSFGCTGSIVYEDLEGGVGLMAAHCVQGQAQGCQTEAQTIAGAPTITLTLGGTAASPTDTYDIDRVVPHPHSFLDIGACPTPRPAGAATCSSGFPIFSGEDLALFHFRVKPGAGHHPPSFYGNNGAFVRPLRILTSMTDANSTPYTTHAVLDVNSEFVSSSATTLATLVGFGFDDLTSGTTRRSGPGAFHYGPDWDALKGETQHDCTESTANPFTCPSDGLPHCADANWGSCKEVCVSGLSLTATSLS